MNDGVSRKSVLATIGAMYERCTTGDITDYRDLMLESVKVLPSADRLQGEWMRDYSSPIAYRCTACNTLQHWSVIQNGRYNFCPNCGAKMKGADDD